MSMGLFALSRAPLPSIEAWQAAILAGQRPAAAHRR